jgi:GNAT superfamily N-acetyltransferase
LPDLPPATAMPPVRIQLAAARHLAHIPKIERAAATLFSEKDLPLHIRHKVTDPDVLRDAFNESRIWVALGDADEVVGFARIDFIDDAVHLDEMDVLPAYCRRGIGTRLAQTVMDWAMRSGYGAITLVTFRHLPWNGPFYEKLGFVELDPGELGVHMTDLIEAEAAEGIDVRNRIGMKLRLRKRGR